MIWPVSSCLIFSVVMKLSVAPLSSRAVSSAEDWFDLKVNGIFIEFRLAKYMVDSVSSLNARILAVGFEPFKNPSLGRIL